MREGQGGAWQRWPSLPLQCRQCKIRGQDCHGERQSRTFGLWSRVFPGYLGIRKALRGVQQHARGSGRSFALTTFGEPASRGPVIRGFESCIV